MIGEAGKSAIRDLLSDDHYGLWEIKWRLERDAPENDPPSPALVNTLVSMIEAGEIAIFSVDRHPDGDARRLTTPKALEVVRSVQSFEAPQAGSPTFEAGLASWG